VLGAAAIVLGVAVAAPDAPAPPRADGPRTWIYFSDKGPDPAAALETLASTAHPRTVERRRLRRTRGGLFDEQDLPVAAAYRAAVAATGASIHVTSRWLNAVSARLDDAQRAAIERLPFVAGLEPVRRGRRGGAPVSVGSGAAGPAAALGFYGVSLAQLEQINLPALHQSGATGAGVIIGVLDTGFERTHMAFNHPGHPLVVVAEYDFIDGDANAGVDPSDPPNQHVHGTLVLGAMGAYMPGVIVGAAYDASYILCKTEDTTGEYPAEEDNYVAGLEFIEQQGGDVATSSLGYIDWYTQGDLDGVTAVTSVAVNVATQNGVHCCTAAGNSSHDADPATSHLIAPADALQVITCGAISIEGEVPGFTSDGPTADGRVKPEVLATGVDALTVNPSDPAGVTDASGTSMATPLVAGAVACLVEAVPSRTVDRMRAALFATGDYYVANGTSDPLFVHGYGVFDALAAAACGPSDVNCDGAVNVQDLTQVVLAWGPCPASCAEDLNGNGAVDVGDLVMVILAWN
jgi:subtilisin family serine protease